MNKHLKDLIELSAIDREIDGFTPKLEAIAQKRKKFQDKLQEAKYRLEILAEEIKSDEEKISSYEEQIKILSEHLNENAKKSKMITTEKEMKALAVEEDIIKEKMSFANEEIERLGSVIESKKGELEKIQNEIKELEDTFKQVEEETENELQEIENAKAKLFAKRQELSRQVDKKILSFYEKIRNWAGNTAVAPVKKQACYGCYMKISDKTYAEVIKGQEVVTCTHCGRILYIENQEAS